jgi:HK97 family phage prohead protease
MTIKRKFFQASANSEGLGDRQVRVVVSTASVDRAGDIVIPGGIDLSAYKANPIVLWNHDPKTPVARCAEIAVKGDSVEALVQFPPEGDDPDADKLYKRIKNGVVNAASIGFDPTQAEPIKGGGLKYLAAELMEFSFVSVPANAEALIVARSAKSVTKDAKPMQVKDLYDVGQLASLLSSLGYMASWAEWEADAEGDGSKVPAMLAEAANQLGAALIAMTAEEVGEMLSSLGGTDKAATAIKLKSFARIAKAGRALSAANEADIMAACELIEGAGGKLASVLGTVASDDDGDEGSSDGGAEKSANIEHYRRRARLAAIRANA